MATLILAAANGIVLQAALDDGAPDFVAVGGQFVQLPSPLADSASWLTVAGPVVPPRRVARRVIEDLHRLASNGGEGARRPSIRASQRNGERTLTEPADIGALERMGLQLASQHAAVEDH